jgi:hypothetical protein
LNSHGSIYPALPADVAQEVAGYKHSGFSFWARSDLLGRLLSGGNAESYNGAGVSGFTQQVVSIAEGLAE